MHDWKLIAEQHGPLVWETAFRMLGHQEDAADCHQDVFVDAIRRADSHQIADWRAFLRWLTVRRALDRLRRRQRSKIVPDSHSSIDNATDSANAEHHAQWNEWIEVLRNELTVIPENQAQVFWLHCIEEVPISEVAESMALTANHTRVLLHRCREHLRAALQQRHPTLIEGHIS